MTDLGFRPWLDGYRDVGAALQQQINSRTVETIGSWRRLVDQIHVPADVAAYQDRVRSAVLEGVGALPERAADLGLVCTGQVESSGIRVEKLIFQSLPHVYVTGNLYRPNLDGPPGPAVLFVCGHSPMAKADSEYQIVCLRLAGAGFTVLAIDPFGQGERHAYLDATGQPLLSGTAEHSHAGAPCWWAGQSAARYFIQDARCGIDVLTALPEVDPARIGITGNSGGGTLTTLMMALEPRLAAAAPATYVTGRLPYQTTGQHQDAEQILLSGTANGVDHDDLLAVMAPRPVLVLAARYDFFPIEGTRESVERARRIYGILGAEDQLSLHEAPITHRYAPELATEAIAFFRRTLSERQPVEEDDPTHPRTPHPIPLPAQALRCTQTGEVARDFPGARFIADLNRDEIATGLPGGLASDDDLRAWLRGIVNRDRQRPCEDGVRWLPGPEESVHAIWWSEIDVSGAGVLPRPAAASFEAATSTPLHLVLVEQGTEGLDSLDPRLRIGAPGDVVFVADLRARGPLKLHDSLGRPATSQSGATFKALCDLLWLGDSLAAGQVFDILRAIDIAVSDLDALAMITSSSPVHLHAHGSTRLLAVLAAVIDERIRSVIIDAEPLDPAADDDWLQVIPELLIKAPPTRLVRLLGDRLKTPDPGDR